MGSTSEKTLDSIYNAVYTNGEVVEMETTKIFMSGNSQAVRLPKEYRFHSDEVGIKKVGKSIVLFPKDQTYELFLEAIYGFSDDFMADGRAEQESQERDWQ